MPYFVFRIKHGVNQLANSLEFQQEYASFPEAKALVRSLRLAQADNDASQVRMVFASDRIEAEELLITPREETILLEWEK